MSDYELEQWNMKGMYSKNGLVLFLCIVFLLLLLVYDENKKIRAPDLLKMTTQRLVLQHMQIVCALCPRGRGSVSVFKFYLSLDEITIYYAF